MDTFLHKHAANVIGVLKGFGRLVFRGALRRLVFLEGMKSYLWAANVLSKDFGQHVLSVTSLLKKASSELAEKTSRPMKYLPSSGTDKDKVARRIAEQDGIKEGLICVLTCVEPCVSFDIHRNREIKRLELVTRYRKCLHVYHHFFMMSRQKSGVSMLSIRRMLGIKSSKTVWTMGHKIRKAMADRDAQYQLAGLVEMDEAFIGPRKSGPPGRGVKGKAKVVIADETRDKHAGFAVMKKVPAADSSQILTIAQDKIQPGSDVCADGWRAYQTLGSNGFGHEAVIVSKDKEALKELRWGHVLTANVKSNLAAYTMVSARNIWAGIWPSSHTGSTDASGTHSCSIEQSLLVFQHRP